MSSTYDWPTSRAFVPAEMSFGLKKSVLGSRSPYSGTFMPYELSGGSRLMVSMTLPPCTTDDGFKRWAFFNRISGGLGRVRLGHVLRPVPKGTLRGSPTLKTAVSRGATELVLSNAKGANMLTYPEDFGNAAWNKAALSVPPAAAPDGAMTGALFAEQAAASDLPRVFRNIAITVGTSYAITVRAKEVSGSSKRYLQAYFNSGFNSGSFGANFDLAAGAVTAVSSGNGFTASAQSAGDGWWICTVNTCPATSTNAGLRIALQPIPGAGMSVSWAPDGTGSLQVAWPQMQAGAATAYESGATLKAGDLIKPGTQLFVVAEDCIANGAAELTVPVVNRARGTIAAGTAVEWNRPTADFILPADQVSILYRPGYSEALALDLEEVW